MSKHLIEEVPTGSTYGPAFPLMMTVALALVETVALVNRSCLIMGFCG